MSIKNIYGNLDKALDRAINKGSRQKNYAQDSFLKSLSSSHPQTIIKADSSSINENLQIMNPTFGVSQALRGGFGKHGSVKSSFGCHPDFLNLKENNEIKNGYSVTLFMDIIGSTKLGILYSPDIVFNIKNSIIRCAIETIQAFDGHVHRIMGDAVMAFFRDEEKYNSNKIMDSGIDAVNCGAYLIEIFKKIVIPKLQDMGANEDIGIRIGIDYGPQDEVVWGNYGYTMMQEVTATSFFVDVAAKLQQKAPKNTMMIGDSLRQLLNLDESILRIKMKREDGVQLSVPYISPNYKKLDGNPLNYKQFIISQSKYFSFLPANDEDQTLQLTATIKKNNNTPSSDFYFNCSRSIKKYQGISFKAKFYAESGSSLKFKFRVENTGDEASKEVNYSNHHTFVDAIDNKLGEYSANHWEETKFRGLHHMYVSVWKDNILCHAEKSFSVFID